MSNVKDDGLVYQAISEDKLNRGVILFEGTLKQVYDFQKHHKGNYPSISVRKEYEKRETNPAPRVGTKRPRRVSQVTKKPPTRRLIARRKANSEPGYYPNPISDKIALHLNAGYDTNGNPRRLFVVVSTAGNVVSVHDEGYEGERAVTKHYPGIAVVGQFAVTPAQYRELKKQYKAV